MSPAASTTRGVFAIKKIRARDTRSRCGIPARALGTVSETLERSAFLTKSRNTWRHLLTASSAARARHVYKVPRSRLARYILSTLPRGCQKIRSSLLMCVTHTHTFIRWQAARWVCGALGKRLWLKPTKKKWGKCKLRYTLRRGAARPLYWCWFVEWIFNKII